MSRIYLKTFITGFSLSLFLLCTSFNISAEEEKTDKTEDVVKTDMTDNARYNR